MWPCPPLQPIFVNTDTMFTVLPIGENASQEQDFAQPGSAFVTPSSDSMRVTNSPGWLSFGSLRCVTLASHTSDHVFHFPIYIASDNSTVQASTYLPSFSTFLNAHGLANASIFPPSQYQSVYEVIFLQASECDTICLISLTGLPFASNII